MATEPTFSKGLPFTAITESPRILRLAVGLLMLDALLLGIYMAYYAAHFFGVDSGPARFLLWDGWHGSLDHSVLEVVGYVKMLVASGVVFLVARKSGQHVYLAWAVIFLLIVFDDAGMLHEEIGTLLTELTGAWVVVGLRAQDVGELLFWLILGALLALWLLKAHLAASCPARRDSIALFAGTVTIAIFSIGFDLLHALLSPGLGRVVNELLHFFEAAGEVAGMTIIVVACAVIWGRRKAC